MVARPKDYQALPEASKGQGVEGDSGGEDARAVRMHAGDSGVRLRDRIVILAVPIQLKVGADRSE